MTTISETIKEMKATLKAAKKVFVVVKGYDDVVYIPVTKKDAIDRAFDFWQAGCYLETCSNGDVIIDG